MKKIIVSLALVTPFLYNCTTSVPIPRPSTTVNSSPSIVNYTPGGPLGSGSASPSASASPKVTVDESQKIAFMSNRSGFWDIYNMNIDGSNVQRITKDDMKGPFAFSVSPDGRTIAYISDKSGNPDLWVMDLNNKQSFQATDTEFGEEGSPTWSSDSQRIAFHSNSRGSVYEILQLNYPVQKGDIPKVLISEPNANALHPAFSPDGNKLLYNYTDAKAVSSMHIYDYFTKKDIIATKKEDLAINGSWSPDSNKIIYWTNSSGIFQMNADLSGKAQLGTFKNIKGTPYFSADGKSIIISRGFGFADDYDVWLMDNDGRNPKKLTTEGGISLNWYKVNKTPASSIPSSNPASSSQPNPGSSYTPSPGTGNPYIDPNDPLVNP